MSSRYVSTRTTSPSPSHSSTSYFVNTDSPNFPLQKIKPKPQPENGLEFDSDEERWAWWLFQELLERGALLKVERSPTYELFPQLRLGPKKKEIHKKHSYTADFKLTWNLDNPLTGLLTGEPGPDSSVPVFWRHKDESLIEVKPCFDAHGKTQLANINLKWMYQRFSIIVQLIRTGQGERSFFSDSWTPDKFKLTGTGKERKLNYKVVRSLDDLLETLRPQG